MTRRGPFFDRQTAAALAQRAEREAARLGRTVTFMEVCGTHTHAIADAGLRRMLPEQVRLISGPGCPVCVTPVDYLDRAIALANLADVIICTFGDLMRVPSSYSSLERESARGCDVRIVYSPRDALDVARENPAKRIVFLGVGFETTLPTVFAALDQAERESIANFLVLPGGKLIGPPLRALVNDDDVRIDGFILPGHVSVIVGSDFYAFLVDEFRIPAAIAGFTPVDIMTGVVDLLRQINAGDPRVSNLYTRAVQPEGNLVAKELLEKYCRPADTIWRGLGLIPASGLAIRSEYAHRDASKIEVDVPAPVEPPGCRCGEVLKGTISPPECPLYASTCTPDSPVGACMVSSEGTCAAWRRHEPLMEATR